MEEVEWVRMDKGRHPEPLAVSRVSGKTGNGHMARFCKTAAVQFDTFNFMQSFCCEVTFATVRAGHDRHILNDQQIRALAVTPRNVPDLRPALATDFADKSFRFHVIRHKP